MAPAPDVNGIPVLDSFTNEDAYWIGTWLWQHGLERGLPLTIDIRRGDQQLFHAALPGTSADNDAWASRKAALARRFGEASIVVRDAIRTSSTTPAEWGLDLAVYAIAGGAVPVLIRDVGTIGSVAVSGLPDEDDHAFVVEGLRAFQSR